MEGSTLLDGTKTATYVAGYMFLGNEYEYTSAQLNLRCKENELVASLVGDSDLLTREQAEAEAEIKFYFKVADEVMPVEGSILDARYVRDTARLHNAPKLFDFLQKHQGLSAQVQLPVARTGVPEVRELSLVKLEEVVDLILATCGPLKKWNLAQETELGDTDNISPDQFDLDTFVSLGVAKALVEKMIVEEQIPLEKIIEALTPIVEDTP